MDFTAQYLYQEEKAAFILKIFTDFCDFLQGENEPC